MHAKPDLRVFLKWRIAVSGSVIANVIQLSPIRRVNNSPRLRSEIDHAAAKEP
jgi:hypothetical protein